MDSKRVVGMVLAIVGGVLLIFSALMLPAFSELSINEDKIGQDKLNDLNDEERDIIENQTKDLTSSDLQEYLDTASEMEDLSDYKDTLSLVGTLMTVFMWLTVLFGILAMVMGILGSRKVKMFGTSGLSMGIVMAVVVSMLPSMSEDYLSAKMGLGPIVAVVAGILIIAASFMFPKKEKKEEDKDAGKEEASEEPQGEIIPAEDDAEPEPVEGDGEEDAPEPVDEESDADEQGPAVEESKEDATGSMEEEQTEPTSEPVDEPVPEPVDEPAPEPPVTEQGTEPEKKETGSFADEIEKELSDLNV